MFDDIHENYDLLNTLLSFGQDRTWRRKAVRGIVGNGLALDLCGGGGQMTRELLSGSTFSGHVVLADFSRAMLSHSGRILGKRFKGKYYQVVCDAEQLPFKGRCFAHAISAFSLRNLPNLSAFSLEVARVLVEGGKARFLEIGHPERLPQSLLFDKYFHKLPPLLARLFSAKAYAYRYLPDSLDSFPSQKEVAEVLGRNWSHHSYENILGGIAVVYTLERGGYG